MYKLETKYDEKNKEEILNFLKKFYTSTDKKEHLMDKLTKNFLNEKVLNKILNEMIKNEEDENYLTYYIKKDKDLVGLVYLFRERYYLTYNAIINVLYFDIDNIEEKDKLLTKIFNDVIDKWEPFEISFVADGESEYELLDFNGFKSYPIGNGKSLMSKEVRERKYVRKRSNSNK